MEPSGMSYEESQYLDELENEYYPPAPEDLLDLYSEHKTWLEQVQVTVTVEDEEWHIVD